MPEQLSFSASMEDALDEALPANTPPAGERRSAWPRPCNPSISMLLGIAVGGLVSGLLGVTMVVCHFFGLEEFEEEGKKR